MSTIKVILFDLDGVTVNREKYFSQRLADDYNISSEEIMKFFKNEFQTCSLGKADLKTELKKYVKTWQWEKSIEELMDYWFKSESNLNNELLQEILKTRERGIICGLISNNETYRKKYLLDSLLLKNYFDKFYFSCELGQAKPTEEFWQSILASLPNMKKENIFIWDDEQKVINAAQEFGLKGQLYSDLNNFKNWLNTL